MILLKSAILGFIGGTAHVLPLNKNIIFSFFGEANKTFSGSPTFGIDGSSLLTVSWGIIFGILFLARDKLKIPTVKYEDFTKYLHTNTATLESTEKQNLLLFMFYLSFILKEIISFFVNLSGNGLLPLIFWEICTVTLCFFADNSKEKKRSVIFALFLLFALSFFGTSVGICAVIIAIFTAKPWGLNKKEIFGFCINVIFASALCEAVKYLVIALLTGFHFAWYSYLSCFVFAFLGAVFGIDTLKKAIARKNVKLCGYFHIIFILLITYILMSV